MVRLAANKAPGARRRDPRSTRDAILAAAREVMAERGPEVLTVSEVAHRAGVNRGTAYQHFRTREQLLEAVKAWFAAELDRMLSADRPPGARMDVLMTFLGEHRELARLWLFALLGDRSDEQYEGWRRYLAMVRGLAESDMTRDGVDAEMLARILVSATMVWSLWAPKLAEPDGDAEALTRRFSAELKRLLLFGVLRPERWPDLVRSLENDSGDAPPPRDRRNEKP